MYAFLMVLLPILLPLQYDDSRPVGDVAVRLLHDWKCVAGHEYYPQKAKLDRMLLRRGKPPIPEDELTAQADLVDYFRATIDLLDGTEDYLRSLGYRPPKPEDKTPNPPPARPAPPEGTRP
jgi:hypothetical protein